MDANVTLIAAFGAGLLSFVSPCVLPLVPPYLGFLTGASIEELTGEEMSRLAAKRRAAKVALAFVLGFTCVFVALGATASVFGQIVREWSGVLGMVAGVFIIIMGLHFLGVFRVALFYREARFHDFRVKAGLGGESAAVCAVGALLAYIIETQKFDLSHINRLDIFYSGRYMELDWTTRRNLAGKRTLHRLHRTVLRTDGNRLAVQPRQHLTDIQTRRHDCDLDACRQRQLAQTFDQLCDAGAGTVHFPVTSYQGATHAEPRRSKWAQMLPKSLYPRKPIQAQTSPTTLASSSA